MAGLYLAALAILFLAPIDFVERGVAVVRRFMPMVSADGLDFVINVLLFLPVGILLVGIIGAGHWVAVIVFGVLASCWLQLAEMVWLSASRGESGAIVAHVAGTIIGVGTALAAVAIRRASLARRSSGALTPVSQPHGPRL